MTWYNTFHKSEINKDQINSDKDAVTGVVYRPPNRNKNETCIEYVKGILETVRRENRHCPFLGDYNIKILNTDSHSTTSDFSRCYVFKHVITFDE